MTELETITAERDDALLEVEKLKDLMTWFETGLDTALILATELVLELRHTCKDPLHAQQLQQISDMRTKLAAVQKREPVSA